MGVEVIINSHPYLVFLDTATSFQTRWGTLTIYQDKQPIGVFKVSKVVGAYYTKTASWKKDEDKH